MQDSPIQIGRISLQGFEVPPSVRFGGRQRLAIHNLTSGRRVVERLGPDDGEIEFEGVFSGQNAEDRVKDFDNLRLSGEFVWLTWKSFRRRVVVKSFVADYHSPWWIPYKVSCVVAHQAGVGTRQASTLFALISADLGNALSAAAGSEIALTSLQTNLFTTNAMTRGTSNHAQAVAAVGATLNTINNQITQQSALLIAPAGLVTEPAEFGEVLSSAVSSAGLLAAAVNTRSYVGRIGTTLNGSGN